MVLTKQSIDTISAPGAAIIALHLGSQLLMGIQKQLQAMTQTQTRSKLVTDVQTGLRQVDAEQLSLRNKHLAKHIWDKFAIGKNLVNFIESSDTPKRTRSTSGCTHKSIA
eukprot:5541503-Amphidinium_carterae.1